MKNLDLYHFLGLEIHLMDSL